MFCCRCCLQVGRKAIQFQFREPKFDDKQTNADENICAGPGAGSGEVKETGPGLLELSKPSEFRLRALKQKKYVLAANTVEMVVESFCLGRVDCLPLAYSPLLIIP